jgi:hypothetical protein
MEIETRESFFLKSGDLRHTWMTIECSSGRQSVLISVSKGSAAETDNPKTTIELPIEAIPKLIAQLQKIIF